MIKKLDCTYEAMISPSRVSSQLISSAVRCLFIYIPPLLNWVSCIPTNKSQKTMIIILILAKYICISQSRNHVDRQIRTPKSFACLYYFRRDLCSSDLRMLLDPGQFYTNQIMHSWSMDIPKVEMGQMMGFVTHPTILLND